MFNPYASYELKYLPAFKQKGVKAFVKQTYDRGRNLLEENPRPAFLLCHYNDITKAQGHMDAIKHDPNRRLLFLDNAVDYQELQRLGRLNSEELVYLNFAVPNAERKAQAVLEKKLRAYLEHKLNWRIPGGQTVQFSLEFEFGEIYAVLKHGGRYHRVKFDEIETTKGYVL
jgi:hypothetical protein